MFGFFESGFREIKYFEFQLVSRDFLDYALRVFRYMSSLFRERFRVSILLNNLLEKKKQAKCAKIRKSASISIILNINIRAVLHLE